MSSNVLLRQAIAEVTQPFRPTIKKHDSGLLEGYLLDRNQSDDVYLAVLHRIRASVDQRPVIAKCFAFIRKNLLRCPPSLDVCELLLDETDTTREALGEKSKELHNLISFVRELLQTFIVSLDEGMGSKGSKLAADNENKKGEKSRKRRVASGGIPAKAGPPMGLSNIEDSPFLNSVSGPETQSTRSSGSRGVPYTPPPDRIKSLPEPEADTIRSKPSTRVSVLASVPEFSLKGEAESAIGAASALDDLLQQCWQINPPLTPGSDDVRVFAAWPQKLAAVNQGLFATAADAAAAYQTAPRLQARGDFHCTDDSRVCVLVDEEGTAQLRSIAHIQQMQAQQAGPKPRGIAAGATPGSGAASPFPNNLRPLFAYKRYAEQEPLAISSAETAAVVAVVLGPEAAAGLLGHEYATLLDADPAALHAGLVPGAQAVQVDKMASILVKVVMDMWLQEDPRETLLLTLPMLTAAMRQREQIYRIRVFDLLYSLSLHAQMIEPVVVSEPGGNGGGGGDGGDGGEVDSSSGEESVQGGLGGTHLQKLQPDVVQDGVGGASGEANPATRVAVFQQWLRCLLFEMLVEAVNVGDRSEDLWRAALGCLLHLVATGGSPDAARMAGLSAAPLGVLLDVADDNTWSLELQGVLICMACRLCYIHTENDPTPAATDVADAAPAQRAHPLNHGQLAAFGGVPKLLHCMHARPTRRAQRAALAVLLDTACVRVCRLDPAFESYLSSKDAHRFRALLSSSTAVEAVALAATSTDSIGDAAATPAAAAAAAEQYLLDTGRAGHEPSAAAVASLRSVLCALAPAAADADGGVAWAASATRIVDTCLGSDEFARAEASDCLGEMIRSSDSVTQRRSARALASLFWRGRAAFVAGSITSYLPAFAARRPADLCSISLLSPPPPMPGALSHAAPSPLAPLLDTLAAQLHTRASARRGTRLLMHTLHVLMTAFLCRKVDFSGASPGSSRTSAAHVFVAGATIASAVAWLRRVPEHSVALPPMIGIVQIVLNTFAVPRVEEAAEGGSLRRGGVSAAPGHGSSVGPGSSTGQKQTLPHDTSLLSAISLFLKGYTFVPSLAVMALPVDLLLTLRDSLTPPSHPPQPSAAPSHTNGFCGWHAVAGTRATASLRKPPDSAGDHPAPGAVPAREHAVKRDASSDADAGKGLAFGYASARDARVVVYIILLWKFQLDSAALDAAGGCAELTKALQDDDARVRLIVAKFITGRLSHHRKEDFQSALQSLMSMAQSTSNGSLIDNPYIQLQAFLSHELLSVNDL